MAAPPVLAPLTASSPTDSTPTLAALRGLRTAPSLAPEAQQALRQELRAAVQRCRWFTIGIMAPDQERAVACLRACEQSFGWAPLQQEGSTDAVAAAAEPGQAAVPVFLKGNQHTGLFRVRHEAGLGEGLLITGHHPEQPDLEDTWGPLPLDLLA